MSIAGDAAGGDADLAGEDEPLEQKKKKRKSSDGEAAAVAKSEMSPGVLFSTGYIAGASIAGVLIACLSFSDTIPQWLGRWEYRQVAVGNEASYNQQVVAIAVAELGGFESRPATPPEKPKPALAP